MTAKELIEAEIRTLSDSELDELYKVVKKFVETKKSPSKTSSLLSKLQRIQIDGPEDFAENIDLYLSGEKSVQ